MNGKLYRASSKVVCYLQNNEVFVGELLIRITTFAGLSHNSVIFLRENGSFFDLRTSKCSDTENLDWLGLLPA